VGGDAQEAVVSAVEWLVGKRIGADVAVQCDKYDRAQ